MRIFELRSISDMASSFARYLPGGRLLQEKTNGLSEIRKFLNGISEEAVRVNDFLIRYSEEYYPDATTDFLDEWEAALGIPDDCLILRPDTVSFASIEERRLNILVKLAHMNVQTSADFEALAALFGISATVVGGIDASVSPPIAPDKTARFTIVVQFIPSTVFPYTFPILFGDSVIGVLECLFLKIRPANCDVRFDSV